MKSASRIFFDAANGLDGLTWVYETPAAIVELPIDYEFKDIRCRKRSDDVNRDLWVLTDRGVHGCDIVR